MKTLKTLVVRTAPVLVWLACAAAVAAADRPSANSIASGYGVVPFAPAFLPSNGYTGDLTLLSSPSKKASLSLASARPAAIVSVSTDGKPPAPAAYRLRPGDHVTVSVFGEDKLGATYERIDAQGNLHLTGFLVGPMPLQVGGLSVAETEALIASYYRDKGKAAEPRVNVRIDVYAPLELPSLQDKIYEKYHRLTTPAKPATPPAPR